MKLYVWNVNGLRACLAKGFGEWLEARNAAIVGLQETRVLPEQLARTGFDPSPWRLALNPARRAGYSGTALLTRRHPLRIETELGEERFDREGRLQIAVYPRFVFANVYFPNGNGSDRSNDRVPFKLAFYARLLERLQEFRAQGLGVVVGGDFNTAHREIDLKNWRANRKTSGFLPEEREEITRWLEAGYVDVFREAHPDEEGHYTWWSQRQGARERNVGWRIDYLLVSKEIRDWVRRAWIEPEVPGSDHCPVGIEVVVPRKEP